MSRMSGQIVRVLPDKRFGFVKIGRQDYFFHKDDYQGNWDELVNGDRKLQVNCVIVESPKGPRCADVRPEISDGEE